MNISNLRLLITSGALRHLLGSIGVWLVASDYATQTQADQVIGGIMALVAIALSAMSKVKNNG